MAGQIKGFEIKVDNRKKFTEAVEKALDLALEECGSECEKYAKQLVPVDTGLLRNSITYALHGKPPAIESYSADRADKNGNRRSGSYRGSVPDGEQCVYVGSNVEYTAYVEKGSSHHPTPKPFLQPALDNHNDKYEKIFQKHLNSIK